MEFSEILKDKVLRILVTVYGNRTMRKFVQQRSANQVPEKWIFILGCYNSGTTILRTLLSLHPEIRVLPKEGARLTDAFVRPEDLGWERMWIGCLDYMQEPRGPRAQVVDQVIRDWSPWWQGCGNVFVEKSISNVTRIEWLADSFPSAYFIAITRDGYAVSEGIHRRARPKRNVGAKMPNGYPLEWAARQWVDANSRILAAEPLLERFYKISYEDLVEDPAAILSGLFSFIGLESPVDIQNLSDGIYMGKRKTKVFNGNKRAHAQLSAEQRAVVGNVIEELQTKLGY